MSVKSGNPYLQEFDGRLLVTEAGRQLLTGLVTDPDGPVYAVSGLSPMIAAAGMARLSRSPHDMRVIILREFIGQQAKDEELLGRVITEYGDDSVQQLTGLCLVVEGASNIVTKLLERGRLAAYLEQSTRYIFFDQPGKDGKYRYYTPTNLTPELASEYRRQMDQIFQDYSEIVRQLTDYVRSQHPQGDDDRSVWLASTRAQACDAARPLLPAATTSTVGIFASAQALEALIMRLLSEPLNEAVETGQQLLTAARQVAPVFFQRADDPKYGGATTAYRGTNRQNLRDLAEGLLGHRRPQPVQHDAVRLVRHWPANEDAILAEMLFEFTNRPLNELDELASSLSQERRQHIWNTYIGERLNRRHKPGRAFEIPHFEWEIVADYGTFRDLQRHRLVDAMEWQELTPYYGYEVPALVQEAGLETQFRACFERSFKLYERLLQDGYHSEAQYATLLGHRMRYRFVTNLRQAYHLIELRTQVSGHPGYRRICQDMFTQLARVYPLAAAGMRFVNTGESSELTRLAAERASFFKKGRLKNTPK